MLNKIEDNHALWTMKATFLTELERYYEAEKAYEQSLDLYKDVDIMYLYAVNLLKEEKMEKAIKILNMAVKIEPNNLKVTELLNEMKSENYL